MSERTSSEPGTGEESPPSGTIPVPAGTPIDGPLFELVFEDGVPCVRWFLIVGDMRWPISAADATAFECRKLVGAARAAVGGSTAHRPAVLYTANNQPLFEQS